MQGMSTGCSTYLSTHFTSFQVHETTGCLLLIQFELGQEMCAVLISESKAGQMISGQMLPEQMLSKRSHGNISRIFKMVQETYI